MAAPNSPPASPPQSAPTLTSTTLTSLPYSASFTSALSNIVLDSSLALSDSLRGIRIQQGQIFTASDHPTQPSITTLSSVDFGALPIFRDDELPIPLDDPRRKFESVVPGLRVTHPGGRLEGGPIGTANSSARDYRIRLSSSGELLDREGNASGITQSETTTSEIMTYEAYLAHIVSTLPASAKSSNQSMKTALRMAIADETEVQIEELKRQMVAREEAVKKNQEIERQIADMEMQRRVERRVEENMRKKVRG